MSRGSLATSLAATKMIPVWLDQDPGHDDAVATLLAVSSTRIKLVGISTVHGNGSLKHTTCALPVAIQAGITDWSYSQ